jgi:hypothetical protein
MIVLNIGKSGKRSIDSLKQHDFLEYSAKHWATHFRGANTELAVLNLVMSVCDTQAQRFLTWFQVYWTTQYSSCPRHLTGILVASHSGLEAMVQQLLESEGVELDSKDDGGRTPLSYTNRALCSQTLKSNNPDLL